jgi:hypothetical protein
MTPLDTAKLDTAKLDTAKDEVKALLRDHGGKHSLFFAVYAGMEVEEIEKLIKEGADVNQQNKVSPA